MGYFSHVKGKWKAHETGKFLFFIFYFLIFINFILLKIIYFHFQIKEHENNSNNYESSVGPASGDNKNLK